MLIQQQQDENITTEPTLVDVSNVLALTTMARAKEINKDVFEGMTRVTKWQPSNGEEDGISLIKEKKGKASIYQAERSILKPIIKGTNVTWGYAENHLKNAIKIMAIIGWTTPEFLCPKEAFPMVIRSGRRYNTEDNEPIIMIAPRIIQE